MNPNGAEGFECSLSLALSPLSTPSDTFSLRLLLLFFFNGNILTQENVKYSSKYFIVRVVKQTLTFSTDTIKKHTCEKLNKKSK